mmetsp:Transcript_3155/g.10882  ORF Transcript_3155/g.10882 Transcript_3155/m.10882 type:complete len:263 (-) Transcript_3155:12-800(-)
MPSLTPRPSSSFSARHSSLAGSPAAATPRESCLASSSGHQSRCTSFHDSLWLTGGCRHIRRSLVTSSAATTEPAPPPRAAAEPPQLEAEPTRLPPRDPKAKHGLRRRCLAQPRVKLEDDPQTEEPSQPQHADQCAAADARAREGEGGRRERGPGVVKAVCDRVEEAGRPRRARDDLLRCVPVAVARVGQQRWVEAAEQVDAVDRRCSGGSPRAKQGPVEDVVEVVRRPGAKEVEEEEVRGEREEKDAPPHFAAERHLALRLL